MVFIGKGADQEEMEKKAQDLGLGGKCIFVGPVYDRDKLRAWNTRADLFLFPSTYDTNGLVVREAAATGLASVLIKGSCAAEGITDQKNGFLIDESAESMAALLQKLAPDLPHLHEIGQHAMDEIYLSWQSAVNTAYDRYQFVLEQKARGVYETRKKLMADYFFTATAGGMNERMKLQKLGRDLFHTIREWGQVPND